MKRRTYDIRKRVDRCKDPVSFEYVMKQRDPHDHGEHIITTGSGEVLACAIVLLGSFFLPLIFH